jgi:hypothetical protein
LGIDQTVEAKKGYCGKFLYYCPNKQNVRCSPQGNKAYCFRRGEYRGVATRL